jgi:hypothetical protein
MVAPGQPAWCDRPADTGLFDANRASVVLALLLFRWFGSDFLEFPTDAFVASVGNALLAFHAAPFRVRNVPARLDLIRLSLLLMLCTGADFSVVRAGEEAVFVRPLTTRLSRRYGEL